MIQVRLTVPSLLAPVVFYAVCLPSVYGQNYISCIEKLIGNFTLSMLCPCLMATPFDQSQPNLACMLVTLQAVT